jgi:hypothetical protein
MLRAVRDVVLGGAQVLGVLLAAPALRRRYNRWGATDAEVAGELPGDGLVPSPRLGYTRAISVAAPPEGVWPWLAQLGQGRGGFYSFDGLENLVGCRIHSAESVLAQHQDVAPGDLVRLAPGNAPCFRVAQVSPPTALVLIGADPAPPHRAGSADDPGGTATWQWVVRPTDGGRHSRLLVRQRLTFADRASVLWHVVEPIGFVMERRSLRSIKRLAEAAASG